MFKAGDTVECIKAFDARLTNGKQYTLIECDSGPEFVRVLNEYGGEENFYSYRFKLVELSSKARQREFQVGDIVELVLPQDRGYAAKEGARATIYELRGEDVFVRWDKSTPHGGQSDGNYDKKHFRLYKPDKTKEQEVKLYKAVKVTDFELRVRKKRSDIGKRRKQCV